MIGADHHTSDAVARLDALLSSRAFPEKVKAQCTALKHKLEAPVRVGVFGPQRAGKRRLINALVGAPVLPETGALPTLELVPGPATHTSAILSDGSTVEENAPLGSDMRALEPVFLTLTEPACAHLGLEFLLVVCDETYADLEAGLAWAGERVDIAIWCSASWSPLEREVWGQAPDNLLDHSVLCLCGPKAPDPGAQEVFQSVVGGDDPGALARQVAKHIDTLIEEAKTQDALRAELFLQKYLNTPSMPSCRLSIPLMACPTASQADGEIRSQLTRVFQRLRRAGSDLKSMLTDPEVTEMAMLEAFEAAFEDLAAECDQMDFVGEHWADIMDAMNEARDLSVLMRLEPRANQLPDAAALLLQLRGEIEVKIAA
ncbi:MAG: hypothetical protein AAF307_03155 [Pseudomonadota bacterium]